MNNIIKAQNRSLNIDPNALNKTRLHWENVKTVSIVLHDLIDLISKKLGTAPEFVFGSALATIAQAAGGRFCWTDGSYTDYPQAYILLVGNSAVNKSGTMENVLEPVLDIQREGLKRTIDEEQNRKYLYVSGDITIESFWRCLQYTDDGITIYSDEIMSFLGSLGAYSPKTQSRDYSFFLEKFGKYTPYILPRQKGDVVISRPIPRIIGSIQPGAFVEYFKGSVLFKSGFFQRFLICLHDKDTSHRADETIDLSNIKNQWENTIRKIHGHAQNARIELSPAAKEIYLDYKNENYNLSAAGKIDEYEESLRGKLEIYAIQISMMMAIFRTFEIGEPINDGKIIITEADMEFARSCLDYFRYTGVKAYTDINSGVNIFKNNISKADVIKLILDNNWIVNQSCLAKAFGFKPQYITELKNGGK